MSLTFQYVREDYSRLLKTTQDYSRLLKTTQDYSRLLKTTQDYSRLLKTAQDYSRLLKTTQDYTRLLKTTHYRLPDPSGLFLLSSSKSVSFSHAGVLYFLNFIPSFSACAKKFLLVIGISMVIFFCLVVFLGSILMVGLSAVREVLIRKKKLWIFTNLVLKPPPLSKSCETLNFQSRKQLYNSCLECGYVKIGVDMLS